MRHPIRSTTVAMMLALLALFALAGCKKDEAPAKSAAAPVAMPKDGDPNAWQSYASDVVHSHQLLHLVPRPSPFQECADHSIEISPMSYRRSDEMDAFGRVTSRPHSAPDVVFIGDTPRVVRPVAVAVRFEQLARVHSVLEAHVLIGWSRHALEGVEQVDVARGVTGVQQRERGDHPLTAAPGAALHDVSIDAVLREVSHRRPRGVLLELIAHGAPGDAVEDRAGFWLDGADDRTFPDGRGMHQATTRCALEEIVHALSQ